MKRLMTFISAGIIALLSFTSCHIEWVDDSGSIEASLTCYYAGGMPAATAFQTYDLHDTDLSDREIEDVFYELSEVVRPGFSEAMLEINIYDSRDHYRETRLFEFWWETTNIFTGDGFYAWEEVFE